MSIIIDEEGNALDGDTFEWGDSDAVTEAVWAALEHNCPVPAFAPDGEADKYRDLWNENMPRVSGRMYFAIPGEQPIHVSDELARLILTHLSETER
jgi:hypothetical protein